jgi:translocator protein
MESRALAGLVASFVLVFAVSAVGALFPPGDWYAALERPPGTPPNWLFAPVWTALYAAMAVAAWMVWRRAGWGVALALFVLQLALNGTWSWLFFGLNRPGVALVEITALWLAIAATLLAFRRVRPAAGMLLAPYLAWVSYAAYLNAGLWWLNRGA